MRAWPRPLDRAAVCFETPDFLAALPDATLRATAAECVAGLGAATGAQARRLWDRLEAVASAAVELAKAPRPRKPGLRVAA